MSIDSDHPRPSLRFRDKFSHLKDRIKDKVKDKAIKHNITLFIHENITSTDSNIPYSETTRHGFRQHMRDFKNIVKNKTHYDDIKHRIKDKIDEKFGTNENITYPKGFYDSLFSPETENDVYLKTGLICLWAIALLCIIPTIIVIFVPGKKRSITSINMIFFHVFLCEFCYLMYILLAIINVEKDFRLPSLLCDFANYGMYATIPIMQFALLFLTIERLSKHFNLSMTWLRIFSRPYLIQLILCVIWLILGASLITITFIRKQFSFDFFKSKIDSLAPPIIGDVIGRIGSRPYHCSIDGRLSSVFKTIIIILFVILIIKPIIISFGFNVFSRFCCKNNRKDHEQYGDRRVTRLVTIFILLNFLFSFPFYFTSMLYSIFTNIESTKDSITLTLKVCFILRIINVIFECLAFYIFERNSWTLLSTVCYYLTCKKFSSLRDESDDDKIITYDPDVQKILDEARNPSKHKKHRKSRNDDDGDDDDEDEDEDGGVSRNHKRQPIKRYKTPEASNDDDDDDNDDHRHHHHMNNKSKNKSSSKRMENDDEDEDDNNENKQLISKQRTQKHQNHDHEDDNDDCDNGKTHYERNKKRKSRSMHSESDFEEEDDDDEEKPKYTIRRERRKSKGEHSITEDDEENESKHKTNRRNRKSKVNDDEETRMTYTTKSSKGKSTSKREEISDNDQENESKHTMHNTKRKSKVKHSESDDDDNNKKSRRKSNIRNSPSDDENEDQESDTKRYSSRRKSQTKKSSSSSSSEESDDENQKHKSIIHDKRQSRRKTYNTVTNLEPKSTANRKNSNSRATNEKTTSHRSSSPVYVNKTSEVTNSHLTTTDNKSKRRLTHPSSSPNRNNTETKSSSDKHRTSKLDEKHHSHDRKNEHTSRSSKKTKEKKPKKDHRTRILEMSHEV